MGQLQLQSAACEGRHVVNGGEGDEDLIGQECCLDYRKASVSKRLRFASISSPTDNQGFCKIVDTSFRYNVTEFAGFGS